MLGIREHLEKCIIPFWKNLIDHEYGGFFGKVSTDLVVHQNADKSLIAQSRHLYTFSLWYQALKDESLLPYMHHSYTFLKKAFYDEVYGGYYWMVNRQGQSIDQTKHIYGQVFVIYALSEYALATKNEQAIEEAFALFQVIDHYAHYEGCHYDEQFLQDWKPIKNGLLAAHGIHLPYTTNTLLHLLEAYTNLYRVRKDSKLKDRILELLNGFSDKLYNKTEKAFYMYLDETRFGAPIGQSYGHDIETCWLIDRTCEVLDIQHHPIHRITRDVAEHVYTKAMTDYGLISENIEGVISQDRIWWIQAEAMVGFMNHYQKTHDTTYLEATKHIYQFIQTYLVDSRANSEWFWGVDASLKPIEQHGIAEAWKAPYHNGRALIELLKRGLN